MNRWTRQIFRLSVITFLLVVITVATLLVLLKGRPSFYRRGALSSEQVGRYAGTIENKVRNLQSRVLERLDPAATPQSTPASATAGSSYEVSFTEDEINALFQKWDALNGWQATYGKVLADPTIALDDGKLILAAEVKEASINAVVGLQFEPRIDPDGRLRPNLMRVTGGRLPMPRAVYGDVVAGIEHSLREKLPAWQARAAMDAQGVANAPGVSAALALFAMAALEDRTCESVAFIPVSAGELRSLPVWIESVVIADKSITVRLRHLRAGESKQLLDAIKAPLVASK